MTRKDQTMEEALAELRAQLLAIFDTVLEEVAGPIARFLVLYLRYRSMHRLSPRDAVYEALLWRLRE